MPLLDRLAASAIGATVRPFRRLVIIFFGGLLAWLALGQLIVHTIDPHPSEGFTIAFNVAGAVLVLGGVAYTAVISPLLTLAAPAVARIRDRYRRRTSHTGPLGSAHWGATNYLRSPTGLVLGREGRTLLRFAGEGHVLTVAPTGAGKGVSAVIPNLLTYRGSVLVTDPKGENFAVTARARRALGQRVHVLDPFGTVGGTDTFNPLDVIDPDALDAFDEATLLADMLVVPDGASSEDAAHWTEEARSLLTGLLLYVAAHEPPIARTLTRVRQLLTAERAAFLATLRAMQVSTRASGLIAEAGNQLLQKSDKEQSGVVSTAQRHTHFLSSPRMARILASSSFSFRDLKADRTTVYLVLPPHHLDSYRRWLRLMVGCALDALVRDPGIPSERVLLLFDEFPNLGRMLPIVRHVTLLRGYGATVWLLTQDLSQLRAVYPAEWESLLAAADVVQAFGINDLRTAEHLSRLTGDATVRITSDQSSRGTSREPGALFASRQERSGTGTAVRGRPLLFPDEIRRLDPRQTLLFLKAREPLLVDRADYRTDPEFRGLADPNPLHAPIDARPLALADVAPHVPLAPTLGPLRSPPEVPPPAG